MSGEPRAARSFDEVPSGGEGAPRVPGLERARLVVWAAVATLSGLWAWPVAEPGVPSVRAMDASCAFVAEGAAWVGGPCRCDEIPADLRGVLSLPLPLATVSAADLERLPGLGPARAQAIVLERARRGGFASLDELQQIRGLGPRSVAALRDHLFVGADPACAVPALTRSGARPPD